MPPEKSHDIPHHKKGLFSPITQINLALLCIAFLGFVMIELTEFLTSIVIMLASSLILTYLLLGPIRLIEMKLQTILPKSDRLPPTLKRTLSIVLVYLIFLGLFAVAILRVVPTLNMEIREFAHDLPVYLAKLELSTGSIGATTPPSLETRHWEQKQQVGIHSLRQTITQVRQHKIRKSRILAVTTRLAIQKLATLYSQYASRMGNFLLDLGTTTLSSLVYALTTLVLVFYLLHDGKDLQTGFIALMPTRSEAWVSRFLQRIHVQFYSIVRGQALMSIISGSLIFLILTLLQVKYALLLGVAFGLVSILPVLGPWLGLIPIVVLLSINGHPLDILQVLLFLGLFYLIKTYWLWPKILHKKFDIHPILFIITFLACLQIVGFLGILLSFPLTSIFAAALEMLKARYTHPRQASPASLE
jgi:predicted PurR-regulated permease PerM